MRVLVIGRALNVWEEVAAAKALASFDQVILIGQAGTDYPEHLDHWVSFHTTLFSRWIEVRRHKGYPDCSSFWASTYQGRSNRQASLDIPLQLIKCEGGSSGLIGTMVAVTRLQASHVVLAGIPMDADRGHYDMAGPWKEAQKHRGAWVENKQTLTGRVRSMSGWTCLLLGGPPTREWLLMQAAA